MKRTRFKLRTDGLKKDFPKGFFGFIGTIKNHYRTGYWIRLHRKNGQSKQSTGLFWRRDIPICGNCLEQYVKCKCAR